MFERTYVGSFYKKKFNFRAHFIGKQHIVDFFGLQIQIQHTRIREEKLLRGPGINVA